MTIKCWTAAALACVVSASGASAQDAAYWAKHHHVRHAAPHVAGDIYVHREGRSYLQPGAVAFPGSSPNYVSDTFPISVTAGGSDFMAHSGSWDLLPGRFTAPGRDEPLFQF